MSQPDYRGVRSLFGKFYRGDSSAAERQIPVCRTDLYVEEYPDGLGFNSLSPHFLVFVDVEAFQKNSTCFGVDLFRLFKTIHSSDERQGRSQPTAFDMGDDDSFSQGSRWDKAERCSSTNVIIQESLLQRRTQDHVEKKRKVSSIGVHGK